MVQNTTYVRKQYLRIPDGNFCRDHSPSRGAPRGLIMIEVNNQNNEVKIGWSLCHNQDMFSREQANTMAQRRMTDNPSVALSSYIDIRNNIQALPTSLQKLAWDMLYHAVARQLKNNTGE